MNARALLLSVLALTAFGSVAQADPSTVKGSLVTPPEQTTLTDAWVKVLPADDWSRRGARSLGRGLMFGWSVPKGATRVEASGGFGLQLKPGTYVLAAGAKHCATAVLDLTVPRKAALSVPLRHLGVASLTLTVVDGAKRPLPTFDLALRISRGARASFQQVKTDAAGKATIRLAPGHYELAGQEEPWNMLATGPQETGRLCPRFSVRLTTGVNAATIQLLGKTQRPGIHVTVVDAKGAVVPRAWVALQPDTKGVSKAETWRLLEPDGSPPKTGGRVSDADWNARPQGTDPKGGASFLDDPGRSRKRSIVVVRKGFLVGRSAPIVRKAGDVTSVRVVLSQPVQRGHVRLILKTPPGVQGFLGAPSWAWTTPAGESLAHSAIERRPGALLIPDLPAGKATVWIRTQASFAAPRFGVGGGRRPLPTRPTNVGLVARVEVTIEAGKVHDRTVELERGRLLEVQLLDPAGKPVQGRVLFERYASGPLARRGRPYRLSKDGFLWVTRTHPSDESVIVVDRPRPKGARRWPAPHRFRVRPTSKGPIVITVPKP